jgi:hypothetical protein
LAGKKGQLCLRIKVDKVMANERDYLEARFYYMGMNLLAL